MTISSTISRWEYTGDGSTTGFTYSNKIFANTELEVYSDNVLQTLATDYTVSGVGQTTGGTVTYVTAPASSVSVVIIRVVPDTQGTDYPAGGSFPSTTVEDDFDRRTIVSQQQQEIFDRTIKTPSSEAQVDMTLPVIATRASKYLGFDSSGLPVELDAPANTTAVSTYSAAQLLLTTAAAWRTGLDLVIGTDVLANVVEDTTPQLGGDLDLNGKNIDFPTTANISDCLDEDTMSSDSATMLATQQSIKAYVDASVFTRGSIDGLILSNDTDTAHDIAIATGEARDGGDAANMTLAAVLTKQIDAAWAVGDDAGGLDGTESVGGTPDASTWYHV